MIGYQAFERVGAERFTQLLDHLRVAVEDMDDKDEGVLLLLDVVRSSRETQRSPHWCWELTVERTISMLSPPNAGAMTGENLSHSMVLLFRNQPNTTQEFKSWMERWIQECKRAHQSRPNGSASEHMKQPNTWITVRLSSARSAYRVSCRAPFFLGSISFNSEE